MLNANQNLNYNYWIKTKGYADCTEEQYFQTAILQYNGTASYSSLPQGTINYNNSGPNLIVRKHITLIVVKFELILISRKGLKQNI